MTDLIDRARKRAADRLDSIGDPNVDHEAGTMADAFLVIDLTKALEKAHTALVQCRNLTEHQHLSPSTVEAVGKRVGEIARKVVGR